MHLYNENTHFNFLYLFQVLPTSKRPAVLTHSFPQPQHEHWSSSRELHCAHEYGYADLSVIKVVLYLQDYLTCRDRRDEWKV
jgi:hypothetical protein